MPSQNHQSPLAALKARLEDVAEVLNADNLITLAGLPEALKSEAKILNRGLERSWYSPARKKEFLRLISLLRGLCESRQLQSGNFLNQMKLLIEKAAGIYHQDRREQAVSQGKRFFPGIQTIEAALYKREDGNYILCESSLVGKTHWFVKPMGKECNPVPVGVLERIVGWVEALDSVFVKVEGWFVARHIIECTVACNKDHFKQEYKDDTGKITYHSGKGRYHWGKKRALFASFDEYWVKVKEWRDA